MITYRVLEARVISTVNTILYGNGLKNVDFWSLRDIKANILSNQVEYHTYIGAEWNTTLQLLA